MAKRSRSIIVQKRTPTRSRVFVVARLQSNGGSEQVRIRDLSPRGALLEAEAAPRVGTVVRLARGSVNMAARVAWTDSTWFGVEFNQPLKTGFLAEQIRKQLKVSAPRWYRHEYLNEDAHEDGK